MRCILSMLLLAVCPIPRHKGLFMLSVHQACTFQTVNTANLLPLSASRQDVVYNTAGGLADSSLGLIGDSKHWENSQYSPVIMRSWPMKTSRKISISAVVQFNLLRHIKTSVNLHSSINTVEGSLVD